MRLICDLYKLDAAVDFTAEESHSHIVVWSVKEVEGRNIL